MKKGKFKARVVKLLLEIHRGFMPDEASPTDLEVLSCIPKGLTSKANPDEESTSLVSKPFTYKWVAKRLKKDFKLTSYDMLVEAGFKEPNGS